MNTYRFDWQNTLKPWLVQRHGDLKDCELVEAMAVTLYEYGIDNYSFIVGRGGGSSPDIRIVEFSVAAHRSVDQFWPDHPEYTTH